MQESKPMTVIAFWGFKPSKMGLKPFKRSVMSFLNTKYNYTLQCSHKRVQQSKSFRPDERVRARERERGRPPGSY